VRFSLYIRDLPHQARELSLLRGLSGFFVAPSTRLLAALCFYNAHD
jgi:hypothetical protein